MTYGDWIPHNIRRAILHAPLRKAHLPFIFEGEGGERIHARTIKEARDAGVLQRSSRAARGCEWTDPIWRENSWILTDLGERLVKLIRADLRLVEDAT